MSQRKAEYPRLKNAPIVEAIVDIDCEMPEGFDVSDHESAFHGIYRVDFPTYQKRINKKLTVKFENGVSSEVTDREELFGYVFYDIEKKSLIQVRNNGFSFNRLRPYDNLDSYYQFIFDNLIKFSSIANVAMTKRLSLRFINQFDLSCIFSDINKYVKNVHIQSDDNLYYNEYINRITGQDVSILSDFQITIRVNQIEEKLLRVVIDIQCSMDVKLLINQTETIKSKLELLRDLKNEIFFTQITELTVNHFNHSN